MIRVLIADDEEPARAKVRKLLDSENEVEIVAEAGDGAAAVEAIREHHPDLVFLDIRANAFLYHMVRNIAGSLMAVGTGERDKSWFAEVFAARDRSLAAVTAPAAGLYFVRASYEERHKLPTGSKKPVLF